LLEEMDPSENLFWGIKSEEEKMDFVESANSNFKIGPST